MILIISFADNEHVRRVTEHLTRPHRIVDIAWFPSRMALTARSGRDGLTLRLDPADGGPIEIADVGAVWCRRLRPITIDDSVTDPVARMFAWSESNEALQGLWHSLDAFWMNPPLADEAAQRKILQLKIAMEEGLAIPQTCITSDPAEARAFIDGAGETKVIRKAFRNIAEAPRPTATVEPADLARLDAVRFAPVIFQHFVAADLDLRTTVIDGEMFTAAIRSDADHQVDYRQGLGTATVTPYDLPEDVAEALRRLMDRLGLKFGAVDFRVSPEGEHVFLEVNPAGEYLFACDRTGQPVPQAIAACLERHDTGH